ncbi:MinD/ParA family protein [Dissulfurirhabdus thermomarina]|uniref:MinD/ParA family protein n=1 Tax=Dissulfurirhabdus thermomarina TaxID=1765737 RepID=A0A6N9TW45_DISTH|nr:MinD/ParA family protein [Dissulfurirhabdus thermomarina]NDY42706.1 MinD/ParA family protein [Dissulfurirhabdus thermomarina]NMX24459.1 MinD/ParA family protein [Dissulfurirhabdus thermomarina]
MNQAATVNDKKPNGGPRQAGKTDRLRPVEGAGKATPCVLAFTSGKGGVGKTNLVTNTALALARMGQRVLVLDADLGLANVDVLLGLMPRYSIKDVFSGQRSLPEIILDGPGGIRILPASSGVPELLDLSESEKLFLLTEMEALDEAVDVLLIDTAAGISDNVLYFNLAAQKRIVVVTPEPTSITDAYALMKVLMRRHQVRDFSILVNWAKNGQEAQKVYRQLSAVADRFLGLLSLDYLGFIPQDEAIPKAVRKQKAVLELFPDAASSRVFRDLAKTLTQSRCDGHADGNIKFFWRKLLQNP